MAAGLILAACSSDDSKKDGGTDGSVGDTGTSTDTGVMDSGPKDSGVAMGCQAADGGAAGCRSCCVNTHPDGAVYFQGAIHACVCAGQYCSACNNNYCNMPPQMPSQNCATCALATLNADGGPCFGPVGNACANNMDCTLWFQCNAACK